MSRGLDGPWLAPANPTFDGRAHYAAKTASDGKRRFLFGWLPTRAEEKDEGHWQWGGDLVVHEIVQQPGGELTVRAPETVLAAFTRPVPLVPARPLGAWELSGRTVRGGSPGRYSACVLAEMPDVCLVETEVTIEAGTRAAGLLLRASDDLNSHYQLRIEPARRRLVLDRAPRPGDQPFMLERPLETRPGVPVKLRVLVDGACLVAYADDRVALSCRLYNSRRGQVGLFVTEGQAVFGSLAARAP
jgi:beta-fructofuranosidase